MDSNNKMPNKNNEEVEIEIENLTFDGENNINIPLQGDIKTDDTSKSNDINNVNQTEDISANTSNQPENLTSSSDSNNSNAVSNDNDMIDASDEAPSSNENNNMDSSTNEQPETKNDENNTPDTSEGKDESTPKSESNDNSAPQNNENNSSSGNENKENNAPEKKDNSSDKKDDSVGNNKNEPKKDNLDNKENNKNNSQDNNQKNSNNNKNNNDDQSSDRNINTTNNKDNKNINNSNNPSSNNVNNKTANNKGQNTKLNQDNRKGANSSRNNRRGNKENNNSRRNTRKSNSSRNDNKPKRKPFGLGGNKNKTSSEAKGKVKELIKSKIGTKAKIIISLVLAAIVLILIIFMAITASGAVVTPGQGNDIKDEFTNFSERDKKILEQVNNINGIQKNNAELAVYTLLFPYFESLQNGSINSYLIGDSTDFESSEEEQDYENAKEDSELKQKILESFGCDELCQELLGTAGVDQIVKAYSKQSVRCKWASFWGKSCDDGMLDFDSVFNDENKDEEEQTEVVLNETDDPYVSLLAKKKYQEKLKELLSKLSVSVEDGDYESETEFFNELTKEKGYFETDAGYKALFMQTNDKEGLENAIIQQLIDGAKDYEVYIKEHNCVSGYTSSSIGQVSLESASKTDVATTKANVTIHLGEAGCTTGNKSCGEGWTGSMADYVMGVTYEEIGSVTGYDNIEKIKAQMLLAKQFLLNVAAIEGDETNGYHLYVRWAQADQDFCDIYNGCQGASSGGSMGHGANRDAASSEMQEIYKEAWEDIKSWYIGSGVDTDNASIATGLHYMDGCPSNWICMDHSRLENNTYDGYEYKQILEEELEMDANSLVWLELDGEYASAFVGSSSGVCSNSGSGLGIPDDEFIFYYQNDYQDLFCGSSSTIAHSGCGGTSYAMLVANLSDNKTFNPVDASGEGDENSCGAWGSNNNLFTKNLVGKHDGFTISSISYNESGASEVLQTIRDGGLVVANVQANSPFTSGGHWIVIRGLTEDGKIKVADPGSSDRSLNGTYDINEFIELKYLTDDSGYSHSWFKVFGPRSEEIKAANQAASSGEILEDGIKNEYFAPIQEGTPSFNSASSTPGCSNSVSHDLSGVTEGTKLYAGMDGTAEFKQTYCGSNLVSYGNRVQITASDGTYIIYAHLRDFPSDVNAKITSTCPKNGSKPPCPASSCNAQTDVIATKTVKKGEYIGTLGNTGNSTGPHLHVEIHPNGSGSCIVDPWAAFGLR